MHEPLLLVLVQDEFVWLRSESNEVDAVLREHQEVVVLEQESSDWRFPKLVALVPILDEIVVVEVEAEDVEGVDADHLVADHDGVASLAILGLIHDCHVAVADVQLVVPADQALDVLLDDLPVLVDDVPRRRLVDLEKIEAELLALLVG